MSKFKYWPFQISAGPSGVEHWIGRHELKARLDRLVRGIAVDRPSTLINIWAYYGAGKTFALRYLQWRAVSCKIWAIYCVTPKGASTFTDLYRAIVSAMTDEQLTVIQAALKSSRSDVGQSIHQACLVRSVGSASQAAAALNYLTAQKVGAAARRDLGVTADLTYSNCAGEALSIMLRKLGSDRGVLLLLDEVQDLSGMRDRVLNETNGLLQGVFDNVQSGLRIVTSFTTGVKETIRQVLGDALFHRASDLIEIPEFSSEEALSFLYDLVMSARDEGTVDAFEPFTAEDISLMIASISKSGDRLVPRELIKRAGNMYETLED
jgi:hypothetical protein